MRTIATPAHTERGREGERARGVQNRIPKHSHTVLHLAAVFALHYTNNLVGMHAHLLTTHTNTHHNTHTNTDHTETQDCHGCRDYARI